MRTETAPVIRLDDYRPSDYLVDRVELDVRLDARATRVTAVLALRPNPAGRPGAPLVLDGDELALKALALDGRDLPPGTFAVDPQALTLTEPPQRSSRSRSRPRSTRAPTPSSWASTGRAGSTARNARRRDSAASPTSSTGRT
jgi:aminopeptidase N